MPRAVSRRYWRRRAAFAACYGISSGMASPESISGLQLWLTAEGTLWQDSARTSAVTASGQFVGAWDDASGNARHFTQGTGGRLPVYEATGLNGRKCIRFDGTDDGLISAAALSTMITASAYTLFVVFQTSAVDTNNATIYQNDAVFGDNASFFGMHLKSVGPTVNAYNFDTTIDTVGDTIAVDTAYCVTQRHSGGTLYLQVNDGTEQSVSSGDTGGLAAVVLVGRAQTALLAGDVRHLAIYNVDVPAADRAALRNWFIADSGIA